MPEASLFGETPEPQAADTPAPAARSRRRPSVKQQRLAAPPPKPARRDETREAIRTFDRFGMLADDERRRHIDALADIAPTPVTDALEEIRNRWSANQSRPSAG